MTSRALFWLLLPLLFVGQWWVMSAASERREQLQTRGENLYAMPAPILKAMTLEHEGLVSDFIFLRTLIYIGKTFERKERPRVREWEWSWINDSLTAASDLDPWFSDPYYLANSSLVWEARRVKEANILLEKAAKYRTWDWMPPFMAGFNYYYFLDDNASASVLLMESARRPGASAVVGTLAARLASVADQTQSAITFLEELYLQSSDEVSRTLIKERLTALLDIQALERAVMIFRDRHGSLPVDLPQLVTDGILVRIPDEPYGGHYRLENDGRVVSSTDLGRGGE